MVNKFNHLHERGVLTLSKEEEEIMGHAIPRKGSNDSSREHLIAMKSRNRFKNINKGSQFRTQNHTSGLTTPGENIFSPDLDRPQNVYGLNRKNISRISSDEDDTERFPKEAIQISRMKRKSQMTDVQGSHDSLSNPLRESQMTVLTGIVRENLNSIYEA